MLNHYVILGLNPDGMNEEKIKYSDKEIIGAYRKAALQYHPDHNTDPTAKDSFNTIANSFKILIDPEKRAVFDRDIEKNPAAFFDNKHLFVNFNDEIPASQHDIENTNLTIVPWKLTHIDLTQLVVNAEYEPEQILQIASENLVFAAAILENSQILMLLTLSQHFELLFILCNKFIKTQQARPDFLKELVQIPNAKQLIEQLIKKEGDYNVAFVSACQKHPELANSFVQDLFREDTNKKSSPLSKTTLLELTTIIPCAIDYLIEFHANKLSLTELEFVLQVNSSRKASILAQFYQKASSASKKKWEACQTLITQIKKEGMDKALQENINLVPLCGTEAFSLIESLKIKHSHEIFFKFNIFNILIDDETCESFTRKYSVFQQEEFSNVLGESLSFFSKSLNRTDYQSLKFDFINIPSNTPVSELLLNQISFRRFQSFLEMISLDIIADSYLEKFIYFILTRKDSIDENPFFLQLLLKTDENAYQCLQNNQALLIRLLNDSHYQNKIATNKALEKKLAITAAKFNCTDEIKMECLPPSFRLIYHAALIFYGYKNSDSKIEYDDFILLWEQTGFFNDLLLIETDHHEVDFLLLESALFQLNHLSESKLLDEYPYLVTRLIKTLAKSSDTKATTLLDLCHSSRLANLFINKIKQEISSQYYLQGSIFNLAYLLIQNQSWVDQYFTAEVANQWHEIFETEIFKKNVLKSYVIFEGINYEDIKLVESYSNNDEQHEQNFEQICHDFKTYLLPKYPRATFSRFLLLKESQQFQNVLTAFKNSAAILHEIDGKPLTELDVNSTLEQLLKLLHETKLDLKVLSRVEYSLRNAPELLAAILTIIEEDSRFHIPQYLQDYFFKDYQTILRLTQPLELIFLNLAKRKIEKYRNAISGDSLLAMYLAHGEEIIPLITCYGLQDKLIVARQLNRVLAKVKTGANQFQSHEVVEQQLIRRLLDSFENIVNDAARDIQKILYTNKIKEYHAELITTIKKNNINDPHLNLLIDTFPREQNKNLFLWLVSLASKQDAFSKQTLLNYLDDPHLIANQDFIQHINGKFLIEMASNSTKMLGIILNSVALYAKVNAAPEFDTILDKINNWPDKTNDSFVMHLLLVGYSYITNSEFYKAYKWYEKYSDYLAEIPEIKVINELKRLQLRIDEIDGALEDSKKKLNVILSEKSVDMQLEKLALLHALQTEQQFPTKIFTIETDLLQFNIDNNFSKKISDELKTRLEKVKASATKIGLDLQAESEKVQRRQQQYILFSKNIKKLGEKISSINNMLITDRNTINKLDSKYSNEENFHKTLDMLAEIKRRLLVQYQDLFENHREIDVQEKKLSELDLASDLSKEVKTLSENIINFDNRYAYLNKELEQTTELLYFNRAIKTDKNDPKKVKLIKEYMKTKDEFYLKKIANEVKFADLHAVFAKLVDEELAPGKPRYTHNMLHDCKRKIYAFYYLEEQRDHRRIVFAAKLSIIIPIITWFVTIPYLAYILYRSIRRTHNHYGVRMEVLDPTSTEKIKSPCRYYSRDIDYRSSHSRVNNNLFNKQGELKKEIYSYGPLESGQIVAQEKNEIIIIVSTPQQHHRINLSLGASNRGKIDEDELKAKYDLSKRQSEEVVRAHRV